MARIDRPRVNVNSLKEMVRRLGIRGRILKGPDRRSSRAVEGMVAIRNSGATRRGAGKSQCGLRRFGPEIGEKRRGANRSAICRFRHPNLRGLWRAPWRCHRSGSYLVRACLQRQRVSAEAGPPGQAALRGTKYSTWGKDIPENTGWGRRRDGKAVDHLCLLRLLIGTL